MLTFRTIGDLSPQLRKREKKKKNRRRGRRKKRRKETHFSFPSKKKTRRIDGKTVELVHAFGRELPELSPETLPPFGLASHCGGCLIDSQAMRARLRELRAAGVPLTNYGLLLSAAAGMEAFERVW